MEYTLSELIDTLPEGQVAKASYAESEMWYIVRENGFFWECDKTGKEKYGKVVLTPSNIRARYTLETDVSNFKKQHRLK